MRKDIQKISDAAKQKLKEKSGEIALLRSELRKANGERTVTFKLPDYPELHKVHITNLPEVTKVEVTNRQRVQDVNVLNIKDIELKLSEMKGQEGGLKAYMWVPSLIVKAVGHLAKHFTDLWGLGLTVRLAKEERTRPIPVIVLGPDGRPAKLGNTVIPMGRFGSGVYVPSRIGSGRKEATGPGAPSQLVTTATPCTSVTITAMDSNDGAVFIGDSTVSASVGSERGVMLLPTGSYKVGISDVSKVYVDALNSGDVVTFNYEA